MRQAYSSSCNGFLPELVLSWRPYYILALIVFSTYLNIFDNAFLYDDTYLIQLNSYLVDWSHIGDILTGSTMSGAHIAEGYYRPLQILLYLFIYQSGDHSPFLFHLLNLILHIANTCLMYRLGIRLGFKPWGVFLAALVWGVHTLNSEAVNYISAVSEPLYSFFALASVVFLAPDFTQKKIFQIIPLFLFGLMSKESMAVFPLLLCICIFLTDPKRLSFKSYVRTWPLWLITFAYMAWRFQAEGFYGAKLIANSLSLPEYSYTKQYVENPEYRLFTSFAALTDYVSLILWPRHLHMDYDFTFYNLPFFQAVQRLPVLIGMATVLISSAFVVSGAVKGGKGIELSWGLLWFGAAFAPDSGILFPTNFLFLEHWMYLPTVGLFLGVSETVSRALRDHKRTCIAISSVVVAFAGAMIFKTYEQNQVWRDPPSFWGNIIKYNATASNAHGSLAAYYAETGKYEQALEHYKKAIAISDGDAKIRCGLAMLYLRMPNRTSHFPDAIASLNRAIELNPNLYFAYQYLGDVYQEMGDKDKAKQYHDRAAEIFKASS